MKTLTREPSSKLLDKIYMQHLSYPIKINGHSGTIEHGPGGWGRPAIYVKIAGITIVANERDSYEYSPIPTDDRPPNRLQVQNWFIEDASGDANEYYWSIADAIDRKNPTSLAF